MSANYNNAKQSGKGKGNNKRRSERSRKNCRDQRDCMDNASSNVGDINDPSYYIYDPNLRAQLPNISFNQFTGYPAVIGYDVVARKDTELTFPTCMRINLNPSAGVTDSFNLSSGVNLAAMSMYTKLSANNAKTSAYAPQDLTTLLYAVSELIALSSHVARIFGVCRLFNYRNRSFPQKIVEYLGVEYQDLIDKFSDYRSMYNNLMVAASKIPIPANIALFQKSSKLYSNVYLDMEGSSMAQTYVFVPDTTWYLNETYNDNGTGLSTLSFGYSQVSTGTVTMYKLLSKLDLMINSLLQSSTLNAIYSDILRLADKEGLPLYQFTTIDDSFVTVPVYNPEVRQWINNMVVVGSPIGDSTSEDYTPSNDVVPVAGSNVIKYKPCFLANAAYLLNPILNFDHQNVTSDEVIEATRLSASWGFLGTFKERNVLADLTLPDHYVTSIVIYGAGDPAVHELPFMSENSSFVWRWSNFDWAPFLYMITSSGVLSAVVGDTNYYTTIEHDFLKRLNDASYQGLLELR